MVPVDATLKEQLTSWYWASFEALMQSAQRAISAAPLDTLDSALVGIIAAQSGRVPASLLDLSQFKDMARDRKKLAAFGSFVYLSNVDPPAETIGEFQKAVERVLRQRQDDSDAWVNSPRLVLGVAMGIKKLSSTASIANTGSEAEKLLSTHFHKPSGDIRDLALYAYAAFAAHQRRGKACRSVRASRARTPREPGE